MEGKERTAERCWMVEFMDEQGNPTGLVYGRRPNCISAGHVLPSQGIRFCRKQDAEDMITLRAWTRLGGARAVEFTFEAEQSEGGEANNVEAIAPAEAAAGPEAEIREIGALMKKVFVALETPRARGIIAKQVERALAEGELPTLHKRLTAGMF